jgi:ABC-2 type transport system ATP-binding protein
MLNTEKTTIILTTHYMDEAEKLCQRIAFIDHGRLVSLDTPENLKRAMPAGELIELGYDTFDDAILPVIRSHDLVISAEKKEGKLQISAKNGSNLLPVLLAEFEKSGITITSISIRSPSLEDVFLYLTGKKLDGSAQDEPVPVRGGAR